MNKMKNFVQLGCQNGCFFIFGEFLKYAVTFKYE